MDLQSKCDKKRKLALSLNKINCTAEIKKNKLFFVFLSVCIIFK